MKAILRTLYVCIAIATAALPTFAQTYRACAQIASAGGHIDGENRACGEGRANGFNNTGIVQCATATTVVPANMEIVSTSKTLLPGGWAAFVGEVGITAQGDGSTAVSVTAKNWSHNQAKEVCVIAIARSAR